MISFLVSVAALIIGYVVYGSFVEKVFGANEANVTPAARLTDGVDFVEMDWKKIFLIQFLNIAGLGPIFGAVAGALWGPVAFIWIVLGSIFAGATHDYFAGMLSVRHDGETIGEIVGHYLGLPAKTVMRIFSVILLVLVGVVFINGPAGLLQNMTGINKYVFLAGIIVYYLLATVLPVDKLIGKIYPIFGAALIFMAIGIIGGIFLKGYTIPEITMSNLHPDAKSIFPFLFITIACGAISGFHATQSPLMARCMKNEKEGRRIFYGAMIAEGLIALIWAAAAMAFYGSPEALQAAGPAAVVVGEISTSLLGLAGGILAVLGVVAAPITSGDTAFRSARLTIADAIRLKQDKIVNRFIIAVPLFAIGTALCFIDFTIIWRYFAWSNQTLATIVLWASAVFLAQNKKFHWICSVPATFMTAVVTSYIIIAPEGLKLGMNLGMPIGLACAALCLGLFLSKVKTMGQSTTESESIAS
ncbi:MULTISPECIES: carbon starvation protein A [unclassified Fusibacter]|uniref:carbon starvation CstA family protein n=1 Tax=unclassified Fusibacter TaxID=2624464 RepID=UPI0010127574|nr:MULTISPECIES: carbon starvation CstA family protein [unclassified Fusibacter]MCK8058197.1 carbon starvation protein A [Fusibacter sp. A2]NPE20780.1 carbon starvation protein A [Fusibacter sp. A1]RXV62986.1 carbon starvation protein A [Fusibacter sp. A1]